MLLRDAPRQVQAERGSGRDGGVAGALRRGPRRRSSLLAPLLALLLPPTLVVASLAEASGSPEDVAALYEEGREAIEEGDFEGASERFLAAYEAIPREELERRAALLFELVEARVAAFSEDGRPSHLCDATEILGSYLDDHTELRGAARSRDARKAAALRETYLDELDLLRSDNPNLNCEDAAPPPTAEDVPDSEPELHEPGPRTPREPTQLVRLDEPMIASSIACIGVGALLLGSATVGVGVGAHAEAEGEWLLSSRPELASDSPEAARLDKVGRQANLLAIIGGTTGAIALGSGIALYVLGKRRQAKSAPTLSFTFTPSLSPNRLGGGLGGRVHLRF